MKKSQIQQVIREEIKKALNEKALLKAINPPLQGEVKQAVGNLENYLLSIGAILDYNHAQKLAYLVIDIIDAAKEEERNVLKEDDRDMSQVELAVTKLLKKANLNPTSVEVYKSSARPGATEALIKFPMAVDPLEVEEAYNDAVEAIRPGGGLIANDSWHKGSNNVVVLDLAIANKR